METKLAVPIAADNLEKAKEQIKAAVAGGAEMLELRSDYLAALSVGLVRELIGEVRTIAGEKIPVVVTCRDKRQGGAIGYPDQLRVEVLSGALEAGAELIDFEYTNFLNTENQEKIKRALSQSLKGRLILSAHNFETKFDNIEKLYRQILTMYPAAIPKLVYTANHINDCFEGFDLLHKRSGEQIIFCMGAAGLFSRIVAKKLNSFLTFASIDKKTATAPGQLTLEEFKGLYRVDSIDSATKFYGVIANPVAHSLSPAVHNACFGAAKMNKLYLPLLVGGGTKELNGFLNNVIARRWLDFGGFSVTIPHKQSALNYVRARDGFVDLLVEKIGAINTLLIGPDSKLSACNTDYASALDLIFLTFRESGADLKDMPTVVIGAGGVARTLVAGLKDSGAKITICNRTVERAEKLAGEFDCEFAPLDELVNIQMSLVVNCTSVGMYPNVNATPLPKECLKEDMVVFDSIYNPRETLLLRQAKEAGAKTIDGLSMFVNQAVVQSKLFTGKKANPKVIRKVVG